MKTIYCILALICVMLAPLNAQSQDDFKNTKFLDIGSKGKIESFQTTGSVGSKDCAVVKVGETLRTKTEFTSSVYVNVLTVKLHLIVSDFTLSIPCENPDLGDYITLPIKAGDRRVAYIDIVITSIYPKVPSLLKIEFVDGNGDDIVALTCVLKIY